MGNIEVLEHFTDKRTKRGGAGNSSARFFVALYQLPETVAAIVAVWVPNEASGVAFFGEDFDGQKRRTAGNRDHYISGAAVASIPAAGGDAGEIEANRETMNNTRPECFDYAVRLWADK